MSRRVRIATWNLEWARPGSTRHGRAIGHLSRLDADIIVTTEDSLHDWSEYPHRIDGGPDWGYPIKGQRRKVIAWSRTPWSTREHLDATSTTGRYVQGETSVRGITYRVIGVCIPWQDAHVRTGRADRKRWAEHIDYCEAIAPTIAEAVRRGPTIVAGDFNQRLPRYRQPLAAAQALSEAIDLLDVPTAGEQAVGQLIDHIAVSRDLHVQDVEAWPNVVEGERTSDHSGVAVTIG
jgi:endonuclease/exonuclease/phosphatase family metal-dependent hydrolase